MKRKLNTKYFKWRGDVRTVLIIGFERVIRKKKDKVKIFGRKHLYGPRFYVISLVFKIITWLHKVEYKHPVIFYSWLFVP